MPAQPPRIPSLGDVVTALEDLWDPRSAESWDAVGLVTGDPAEPVRTVLLAVDPTDAVIDEARTRGAQLILTHHPLLLRGVHSVAATTPKGRRVSRLIRTGVALYTAHTNADSADPGVSDALAALLDLQETRPLRPRPVQAMDKIVVFIPVGREGSLIDALAAAGAGRLGAYRRCAWTTTGTGTFAPEEGARPRIGTVGEVTTVTESRVEMVLTRERREAVIAAMRAHHPYEEPAFDVLELAGWASRCGLGRVGELSEPLTFTAVIQRLAQRLPATPVGLRAAGDPDRLVHRVAVCGGAGDDLLDAARATGADCFVTADLRHHPAAEFLEQGGPLLVDAGHWASEWPWLPVAARQLEAALSARGATVETHVSTLCTDPFTIRRDTID